MDFSKLAIFLSLVAIGLSFYAIFGTSKNSAQIIQFQSSADKLESSMPSSLMDLEEFKDLDSSSKTFLKTSTAGATGAVKNYFSAFISMLGSTGADTYAYNVGLQFPEFIGQKLGIAFNPAESQVPYLCRTNNPICSYYCSIPTNNVEGICK